MTKKLLHFTMTLLLAGTFLGACSGSSDEESEKGAVRQMTDQVAHEMVHKMRSPIDKARLAKEAGEDHLSDLEDAAEETTESE
ncbi:MAG: hypothetical protein P8X85_05080 [Desulfobacterales bacterium]|jgi:hypothetical protein